MGKTLYQSQPVKEQVISEETAFIVNNILQSAADTGGTAHRLKGLNVAAKTGTVQLPKTAEYANIDGTNDTWVAAYNPEYTVQSDGLIKDNEDYLPPMPPAAYTTIIAKHVFEHLYEEKIQQKACGRNRMKLTGKLAGTNRVLLASALTPLSTLKDICKRNRTYRAV